MWRTRTPRRGRLATLVVAVSIAGGLGAGAAGSAVAAPACDDRGDSTSDAQPTTADYLTGSVCPPHGFPYQPNVVDSDAGRRAVDPFTDGCSEIHRLLSRNPVWQVREKAWNFDRWNACATHDYGYDLLRIGAPGVTKAEVDRTFYDDMLADCRDRRPVARQGCEISAAAYYRGVRLREVSGMGDPSAISTTSG